MTSRYALGRVRAQSYATTERARGSFAGARPTVGDVFVFRCVPCRRSQNENTTDQFDWSSRVTIE